GRFGDRQVVPRAWVLESFRPRGRSEDSGFKYGFGWYIKEVEGNEVYFTWGFGGQYIFVIPDLRVVAVFTSCLADACIQSDKDHLDAIHTMVDSLLVPAIR
ncbi:MAG TPA: hypothetical protein VGB15_07025, partial [Longimicrobium sp.]